MIRITVIRKNRYFDSVFLMQVARRIAGQPGVNDASALLATDANKKVLTELGYGQGGQDADFAAAGPNDLVLALEGEEAAIRTVAADPEAWLRRSTAASAATEAAREPRSIREAVEARPDSSVAVISVPGEYAAREARAALDQGLNVFLFSSNVSVEDELSLKRAARDRGLVVMGPDCGTAFLCGAGIGFANAVRRGPIGIVGSSGTGMQEFSCLVHAAGLGDIARNRDREPRPFRCHRRHIDADGNRRSGNGSGDEGHSHPVQAAGGERDAKAHAAPGALRQTSGSLPPRRRRHACRDGKPPHGLRHRRCRGDGPSEDGARRIRMPRPSREALRAQAAAEVARMRPAQRHVRGLFAGGTFCYQSQAIFRRAGLVVYSNSPIHGMKELADSRASLESSFVDMGAEIFVEGRPHPMIDATLRRKRLAEEGQDPSVALVLLDFILGAISSRDPVGDLVPAIHAVRESARRRGDHVTVVGSVCGTDADAQGLEAQMGALADAGVLVFPSNAQAAAFCREAALLLAARKEVR